MLESVIAAALFTAVHLAYFGWVQLAVWVLPFVPIGAGLGSIAWLVYMVAQAPFEYTGSTATVQITDPTRLQWAVIWLATYVALNVWRHLVRLGVSILGILAVAVISGFGAACAAVSAAWSRPRGMGGEKKLVRRGRLDPAPDPPPEPEAPPDPPPDPATAALAIEEREDEAEATVLAIASRSADGRPLEREREVA